MMTLIRRCSNCKVELGFKESEINGFTDTFCPYCLYWATHFNRWRRKYEKNPTTKNLVMKDICEKFLIDKQPKKKKGDK